MHQIEKLDKGVKLALAQLFVQLGSKMLVGFKVSLGKVYMLRVDSFKILLINVASKLVIDVTGLIMLMFNKLQDFLSYFCLLRGAD